MEQQSKYALEAVHISKRFPAVLANDDVCISFERGKVYSILGENGAGKSTLMNILYGLYRPTSGEIRINGETVSFKDSSDAIAKGIGMVHQHFMLVDTISVLENIIAGTKQEHAPIINFQACRKRVEEITAVAGLNIDLSAKMENLSVGEKQRVEIAKALYRGAEIFIFDEPTAVLTPQEIQDFFRMLEDFKQQGKTILFISHKLNEVMEISDRIVIMRSGRVVGELSPADTDMNSLAALMVGRALEQLPEVECRPGEVVFETRGVELLGDGGRKLLKNIDFSIRAGTIVGVAGVDGNGQKELAEVFAGMLRISDGRILYLGQDVTNKGAHRMYEMGFGHIPADRNESGSMPNMTLAENFMLQEYNHPPYSTHGLLNTKVVREHAKRMIEDYDVRPREITAHAHNLSGGNLQKVILGREMSRQPKFLIAVFPTRGLDVGAIEFVHRNILKQKAQGSAILIISTELEEIFKLSDYIAVMYEGEFTCLKPTSQTNFEEIGLYMTGAKRDDEKPFAPPEEEKACAQ